MFTVATVMQLVAIISATAPHAEIRHFRGPVASESATQERLHKATEEAAKRVHQAAAAARKLAHGDGSDSFANYLEQSMTKLEEEDAAMHQRRTQESLHKSTEEAAQRVHEAAAAARKTAHGDGSDSFANYLEQSMVKLEQEDEAMHQRAKERIAQHELDRKVQLQINHAHEVAHRRAMNMTPEQAYQQLHDTAERIRKKAHKDGTSQGDGSDNFANELEQSIMALEDQKHENEFKAHERRIQHEREHENREDFLSGRQVPLGEDNKSKKPEEQKQSNSDKWANELQETILDLEQEKHDFEEKARLQRAKHKLENDVDQEVLHAMQPKTSSKFMARKDHIVQQPIYQVKPKSRLPGLEDGATNDDIVQSAAGFALFLLIGVVVFAILSWQKFLKSRDQSVVVPGLGKVNVVESERMMMSLMKGVTPNSGLAVYGDDARSSAPLRSKSAFSASQGTQGYGIFTL